MFGLESVLVTGAFKLALGIVGIVMARFTLMWMDRYIEDGNGDFAVWINDKASNQAKGLYYAGRFIAVAIIIGSAIG